MVKNVKGKEDLTRLEDMNLFEHDVSEPGPPDLPVEAQSEEVSPLQEFSIEEGLPETNGQDSETSIETSNLEQANEDNTEDVLGWADPTEINDELAPSSVIETSNEMELSSNAEAETEEDKSNFEFDSGPESGPEAELELQAEQPDPSLINLQHEQTSPTGTEQIIESEAPTKSETELNSELTQSTRKEDLSEVKKFAAELLVGDYSVPGKPPFSIAIKNIRSDEDREDILRILKEHSLTPHKDEEQTRLALARGSLLIPQMGEYAAILLTHQLRRFQIDLLVGPASLIHSAKSYIESAEEKSGPQNARSVRANQQHEEVVGSQDGHVQLTTLGHIEGRAIRHNRGPLFFHKILGPEEWNHFENHGGQVNFFVQELDAKAIQMKANAILGIQMIFRPADTTHGSTQITISGQAVWIE